MTISYHIRRYCTVYRSIALSGLPELHAKSHVLSLSTIVIVIGFSVRSVLLSYTLFFGTNALTTLVNVMITVVTLLVTVFIVFLWGRKTIVWMRREGRERPNNSEYVLAVYGGSVIMGTIGVTISNQVCNAWSWSVSNEANLVSFVLIQLLITVAVTVLPGRINRMDAMMSGQMLSLKQVFVRYVSHEIR